jgi:excisionase family DNA binding protein
MSDGDALITIPEAARRLGLSERTLRDWVRRGTIDAWRPEIGRGMLLSESSVEMLARQLEPSPLPREHAASQELLERISALEGRVAGLEEALGRLVLPGEGR